MKVILIDPASQTIQEVDEFAFEPGADPDESLDAIYRLLHVDAADAIEVVLDGHTIVCFCDEYGLFRLDDQTVTATMLSGMPPLVGRLLCTGGPKNDSYVTPLPISQTELARHVHFVPWSRDAATRQCLQMLKADGIC